MKNIFKIPLLVVISLLSLVALFFIFITVVEYRPKDKSDASLVNQGAPYKNSPESLKLLSWNIGFAGLDRYTDFVLDGGTMGKPRSKEAVETALNGVIGFLSSQENDVLMLQEVDRNSTRSYRIDEAQEISSSLSDYSSYFANNYRALFVPYPIYDPIKKVDSGVLSITKMMSYSNIRWQMPGYYSWPTRTVHLKRCALETRIESVVPGKDWVLINVHLTAYGDGTMRIDQLSFIKEMMLEYYNNGHYVVIGGDWNSLFPGVTIDQFGAYEADAVNLEWLQVVPEDWTPDGWQWGIDNSVPTTRILDAPYKEGVTFTCLIDGFLVSPNVNIDMIKGHNLEFEFSDHNPVEIEVSAIY